MLENSILAVDFGNVHTRALLIDLVEGVYRLVAEAEERTTATFPESDVKIGFQRALLQLTNVTGRRFLQKDGTIITPEQPDRSGVDAFVTTASIGRPLRTVLIGLMPEISIASAQRAASGTYVDIVDVISLEDNRTAQDQLNAIILARPDLVFITGGTEDGARAPVLERAQIVRLALRLMKSHTSVLYAGNSELVPQIAEIFENVAQVFFADNVRPTLDDEALAPAQMQLASAFDSFTGQRGIGFDELGLMSRVGILPTAQSYQAIISYMGEGAGGILAVDMGSAVSTMSATLHKRTATTIRTDIGVGHSAASLLDAAGLDAVRAWLPFLATDNEIRAYALNKTLHPGMIPATQRELYLEHALLRAGMNALLMAARPTWTPTQAIDDLRAPLPHFQRIIGAGASLTATGRPALSAMLILDALQPTDVVKLELDANALIPALGALARIKPEAVVQVLDANGLENLCTAVSLSGIPRPGKPAAHVSVTTAGGENERYNVNGGELWVYPLPISVGATVRISAARGLSIGGRRQIKIDVEGGSAGLVVDARGRPLPLPATLKDLAVQIPAWYAQATGDTTFTVPAEWLVPPVVVEEKPRAKPTGEQRRTQELQQLGDFSEQDDGTRRRQRRTLFGRKAKEPAPVMDGADEADEEEEERDLRNLLS